jgi:hypothetical protein
MVNIRYPLDLVALVHHGGAWTWFVSEREFWILDLGMYRRAYERVGVPPPRAKALEIRGGLDVVDEPQAAEFLRMMNAYRVETNALRVELKRRIPTADSLGDICEWLPAILVDFDSRLLVSYYSEPFSFEKYVPDFWEGRYGKFYDLVPNEQKYWLENGNDLLELLS